LYFWGECFFTFLTAVLQRAQSEHQEGTEYTERVSAVLKQFLPEKQPGTRFSRNGCAGVSFRDGIASLVRAKNQLSSFDTVPEKVLDRKEASMHTGNLIDQLMAAVERVQERAEERAREEKLSYWYAVAEREMAQYDSGLAGVA
jgi:hypothetical protein